jgi:hypothetical protein
MNARKSKAIKKLSYQILYDWIRFECLSEEERNTMKPVVDSEVKKDMLTMIPSQTHYFNQHRLYLSAWTPKWVRKKIKQLLKKGHSLDNIDYTMLLEKKEVVTGMGLNTGIKF